MKARITMGLVLGVVLSLFLTGSVMAASTDVTLSTEGGHSITEWSRLADGRILCSGEATEPGFGILECDDNGEPKLTTFDNYEDYSAARETKGLSPLSGGLTKMMVGLDTTRQRGTGHFGIVGFLSGFFLHLNSHYFLSKVSL